MLLVCCLFQKGWNEAQVQDFGIRLRQSPECNLLQQYLTKHILEIFGAAPGAQTIRHVPKADIKKIAKELAQMVDNAMKGSYFSFSAVNLPEYLYISLEFEPALTAHGEAAVQANP